MATDTRTRTTARSPMARPADPSPGPDHDVAVVVVGRIDIYLDGLGALIASQDGLALAAVADRGEDAHRTVRLKRPDVVVLELLDLHSEEEGADAVRAFRRARPEAGLVAILPAPDPFAARDALQAEAAACLTPASRTRHLIDAVWHASRGEQYIAQEVSSILANLTAHNGPRDLTIRESEVLRLIALGHTNQEIAQSIHLSVRTVEAHRARLHAKLGATRRADLVRHARDHGLLG